MFNPLEKLYWLIFDKTHRIIRKEVKTRDLDNKLRFVPQFWFLWWHCYDDEIGYQYIIPLSFEWKSTAFEYVYPYGYPNRHKIIMELRKNDPMNEKVNMIDSMF